MNAFAHPTPRGTGKAPPVSSPARRRGLSPATLHRRPQSDPCPSAPGSGILPTQCRSPGDSVTPLMSSHYEPTQRCLFDPFP
jgi:hypothetical protein